MLIDLFCGFECFGDFPVIFIRKGPGKLEVFIMRGITDGIVKNGYYSDLVFGIK
jgi:hypothetical protein